jgi:hypothetical protein
VVTTLNVIDKYYDGFMNMNVTTVTYANEEIDLPRRYKNILAVPSNGLPVTRSSRAAVLLGFSREAQFSSFYSSKTIQESVSSSHVQQ